MLDDGSTTPAREMESKMGGSVLGGAVLFIINLQLIRSAKQKKTSCRLSAYASCGVRVGVSFCDMLPMPGLRCRVYIEPSESR